jgi:type I restriction enzyme M protein
MPVNLKELEDRLWKAADSFRANAGLRPSEYSRPVLGLLFLRYAEARFSRVEKELAAKAKGRLTPEPSDYQARGVVYLPPGARFSRLVALPEGDNLGKALNDAMRAIEDSNPDLKDVFPRSYAAIPNWVLRELIKLLEPLSVEGDAFGQVYEYFMGNFAIDEMQKGGEFYTPASIVKLIVEIIEPYHGEVLDPACGSGGMFVHSAEFVKHHHKAPEKELTIYGTEMVRETLRMCRMNLAVHGLSGDVKEANAYYEDPHKMLGKFDFVMANPPFNVNGVDRERLKGDKRFPFGLPTTDNANYLWMQLFYSALNAKGRAGFVMANSAADARGSELEIRKKLIQSGAVDVIVSVGSNFFYTVTLPCTLWFFDRGKAKIERSDKVLFIDARHIYRQIDRAHRDFTPAQIEFIANIVRLYRGEDTEAIQGSFDLLAEEGLDHGYVDVAGLCKVATLAAIEAQGWSLNPGRYVGAAARSVANDNFLERLEELNEELEVLNAGARELGECIAQNVAQLLEAK